MQKEWLLPGMNQFALHVLMLLRNARFTRFSGLKWNVTTPWSSKPSFSSPSLHTHTHAHARLNESWIWVPCLGEQQWQRLFSDARRRWRAVSRRVREAVGSPLHPPLTTPPPPSLSLAITDCAVRWEIKRGCCCCRHAWEMDASVFLRLPLSPDAHRRRKKGTREIGKERKEKMPGILRAVALILIPG